MSLEMTPQGAYVCMMRHENISEVSFSLLSILLLTGGAIRPRAEGQIKHPSIKCLFPLSPIDVSFCYPLSESLYRAEQQPPTDLFKSDLPQTDQCHCSNTAQVIL